MSKRLPKRSDEEAARKREATRAHLMHLGFATEEAYLEWCNRHSFARTLEKSDVAAARLAPAAVERPELREAAQLVAFAAQRDDPDAFGRSLAAIDRRSLLFDGSAEWHVGGDAPLSDAIVQTHLGNNFEHYEYWSTALRWFAENPMLDRAQVGPIVDWILAQRFGARREFIAPGVERVEPPPQPNLSMRGRRPEAMLREVNSWHRELGHRSLDAPQFWGHSGRDGLTWTAGEGASKRTWSMVELLSAAELGAEGRALGHCVASFGTSCASGRCSIWSLQVVDGGGLQRRLTIELNREGVVVQARGMRNAMPGPSEISALRRWNAHADIQLSRWIA